MKKEISITKLLLVSGCMAFNLAACNGSSTAVEMPNAIDNLSFSATGAKTFHFEWADKANSTHYKLLENPDGVSGFSQVGDDISQGTEAVDHIVPLYARTNAQYLLQSCNAAGCSDSEIQLVDEFLQQGGSLDQAAIKLKPSNGDSNDLYGYSVSLSANGSTLAIGAPFEDSNATGVDGNQTNNNTSGSGTVYVYSRNGSSWAQQAYLNDSRIVENSFFGFSVSLSSTGNTLAIGNPQQGTVSVFTRSGENWISQQELVQKEGDVGDRFGETVSLSADGKTLAIGAEGEASLDASDPTDNSGVDAGAAYIFTLTDTNWSQMAYIKPATPQAGEGFGDLSLSADGSTLAVSARLHDFHSNFGNIDNAGTVYVFTREATTWAEQAKLTPDTQVSDSNFGLSVSLSNDGNLLAVGAPSENQRSGAAYVFSRNADIWTSSKRLVAEYPGDEDYFGMSVSLTSDGTTLAVGAPGEDGAGSGINPSQDNNALEDSGAIYIYKHSDDWTEATYLKVDDSEEDDRTGSATSLATDGTLAVGVLGRDESTGTAYLY